MEWSQSGYKEIFAREYQTVIIAKYIFYGTHSMHY